MASFRHGVPEETTCKLLKVFASIIIPSPQSSTMTPRKPWLRGFSNHSKSYKWRRGEGSPLPDVRPDAHLLASPLSSILLPIWACYSFLLIWHRGFPIWFHHFESRRHWAHSMHLTIQTCLSKALPRHSFGFLFLRETAPHGFITSSEWGTDRCSV